MTKNSDSGVKVIAGKTLAADALKSHEYFMQQAIDLAHKNPMYPFGAVIVNSQSGEVLGQGVNASGENPMFHGEVVAINDYISKQGNQGWEDVTLYTTGEPCPMCMSAMVWAGITRVVWASDIKAILAAGIGQITLSAGEVAAQSLSFYQPQALIGGVLAEKTDKMFLSRKKSSLNER